MLLKDWQPGKTGIFKLMNKKTILIVAAVLTVLSLMLYTANQARQKQNAIRAAFDSLNNSMAPVKHDYTKEELPPLDSLLNR